MSCCVDNIVKITQVRQTDKDESNFSVVWALGVYPVESEDHEIEVTLFVPVNKDERDPNTQSVFVRGEFYSVCGKVVSGMTALSSMHLTLQRDLGSNHCSLKVSLVGVAQNFPKKIDSESAMFKLLYLMNSVCPNESVLFVVGHMEDLNVYAVDTSFVDFCSVGKRKISSLNDSQSTSGLYRSVHSKFLTVHQNVIEKPPGVFLGEVDKLLVDLDVTSSCSRHTRVENVEDDDLYVKDINFVYSNCKQSVVDSKVHVNNIDEHDISGANVSGRNICDSGKENKGKEKVIQPVVHNMRSRVEAVK
ncbi:27633_t:CDS:2, partial [Dentiscutata erythropus]